jgi:peptidoglycan biosynthesis protein MviN/MurJ (putative lipid II flippase)
MWLKAGLWALVWLLASRVLGLLRETSLAASLGASAQADVALLVISLPDVLVVLLAGGALSLVLLPAWAGQDASGRWALQQAALRAATGGAMVVVVGAAVFTPWLWPVLAAGAHTAPSATWAWALGLLACPLAMASAVWATRCQAQTDMTGLYVGNLLFNLVIIAALVGVGLAADIHGALVWVGLAVVVACMARLAWAWQRVRPLRVGLEVPTTSAGRLRDALPLGLVAAAVVVSAVPVALPFVARSAASDAGSGALASFGYAWKLVELPWVLGVQVISTVAFARVAQVVTPTGLVEEAPGVLRKAFGSALALGVGAAVVLWLAAEPLTALLFGWGRMADAPAALASVASQARVGSLALPALAVVSVGSTVVAAAGRLRALAWASAAVVAFFAALLVVRPLGASPMMALVAVQWALAFLVSRQVLQIMRGQSR